MSYQNPIPSVDAERVGKKVFLSFSFDDFVSADEAAESITEYVKEHGIQPSELRLYGETKMRVPGARDQV